jgi:hypothetical protein
MMTTFLIAICVFFIQDELGTFIGFSEEGIPLFQSEKSSDELIAEEDLKILLDPDSIIEISLNGEDIPREKWPEMLSERMSRKPLPERRNRNPDIADCVRQLVIRQDICHVLVTVCASNSISWGVFGKPRPCVRWQGMDEHFVVRSQLNIKHHTACVSKWE